MLRSWPGHGRRMRPGEHHSAASRDCAFRLAAPGATDAAALAKTADFRIDERSNSLSIMRMLCLSSTRAGKRWPASGAPNKPDATTKIANSPAAECRPSRGEGRAVCDCRSTPVEATETGAGLTKEGSVRMAPRMTRTGPQTAVLMTISPTCVRGFRVCFDDKHRGATHMLEMHSLHDQMHKVNT